MIQFVQFLSRNRQLVIVVLALPLLGLFLRSSTKFRIVPENPYPKFEARFHVPGKSAREIALRVTEPAEKTFNGLPGLLSMESITTDGMSRISIVMNESISSSTAYLYLQEKLDRIRLQMPRDVESINVEPVTKRTPAHLRIVFSSPQPISRLRHILSSAESDLQETSPDLRQQTEILVRPDPPALLRAGLSITQVVQALKVSGISTDLGKADGVSFSIGRAFEKLEDLSAVVVGSRGTRPIRLSDVAKVTVQSPPPTSDLLIWYDQNRTSKSGILGLFKDEIKYSSPYLRSVLRHWAGPSIALLAVVLLQPFFFLWVVGRRAPLWSLALFDGLILIHYVFWRALQVKEITVIDFHAVLLTLIIGTTFLLVIYGRIRSYFLPAFHLRKLPRTIEQVSLFTLREILPAFLVLIIGLWLLYLPISLSSVNLPSRFLLEGFFSAGIPVLMMILIFMPILTDFRWVSECKEGLAVKVNWRMNPKISAAAVWAIPTLALIGAVLFSYFPIGISSRAHSEMQNLRGYDTRLDYLATGLSPEELSATKMQIHKKNLFGIYRFWEFTPGGLRYLPELDIAGFGPAIQETEKRSVFGFLGEGADRIPLRFDTMKLDPDDFGDLLLAKQGINASTQPKTIRVLAEPALRQAPTFILRNRLITADHARIGNVWFGSSLLKRPPEHFIPTQWSEYILQQFTRYHGIHVMALVLFFLLLSLYMNSFWRAGMLVLFQMALGSAGVLLYIMLPGIFHADSLWIFYLNPWLVFLGYLLIARVVDIERSRGNDRELSLDEVREQFAPSVFIALGFFLTATFLVSVVDILPGLAGLGLWREALVCVPLQAIAAWLLFRFLVPIMYLRSEEFVDSTMYLAVKTPLIRKILKKAGVI